MYLITAEIIITRQLKLLVSALGPDLKMRGYQLSRDFKVYSLLGCYSQDLRNWHRRSLHFSTYVL